MQKGHEDYRQLFLSYAQRDETFAWRLAGDLSELGVSIWFDKWELEGGDPLHESIGAAIEKSQFVGAVLSPDFLSSRWCRAELDQALTREHRTGCKIVLPLLYRRTQAPPLLEGRLYLNFSRSYYVSLVELCGITRGVEAKILRDAMYRCRPRSLEDVRTLLIPGSRRLDKSTSRSRTI
jgi:hypothetical protein